MTATVHIQLSIFTFLDAIVADVVSKGSEHWLK